MSAPTLAQVSDTGTLAQAVSLDCWSAQVVLPVGVSPTRLSPQAMFHSTWTEFVSWCGPQRSAVLDPYQLWPFGALGAAGLPVLRGPAVYAALGREGRCRYVGQSITVRGRFGGHAAVDGRQDRWQWVLICPLDAGVPDGTLDLAEHVASRICRPLEGERHPRRR